MDIEPVVFSGRIRIEKDVNLGGAKVQLVDEETEEVIAADITDEHGHYRLTFSAEEHMEFLKRQPEVTVRVIDKHETVLVKRESIEWDLGDVFDDELEVPGKLGGTFTPVGQLPGIKEGPMFEPAAMEAVDEAIAMFAPRGERTFLIYANAARCPNPPIFNHENIMGQAHGTLRGNERARRQLVETLEIHAQQRIDGQPSVLEKSLFKEIHQPFGREGVRHEQMAFSKTLSFEGSVALTPKPFPDGEVPCFVPDERFSLVASAAVYAADDAGHAARLIGGLEHGLCGLNESNMVLDAARTALATGETKHLKGVLDHFVRECGPDDGPVGGPGIGRPPGDCSPPFPKRPPVDFCPPTPHCLGELADALPYFLSKKSYEITGVSPDDACAGEMITLTGHNFGSGGGRVCFSSDRGLLSPGICVSARTWSDTRVTVEVPPNADGGYVSLQIKDSTANICGNVIPVFRKGNDFRFDGGNPTLRLYVDGSLSDACVTPGERVTIRWGAMPQDASVDVIVKRGSSTLINWNNQNNSGSQRWNVPNVSAPTDLTVTATAQASCGMVSESSTVHISRKPNLAIDGIEVTQAIQYYQAGQHLTNANDQGPDNSVTLVANKAAWVRVYLRSGLPASFNAGQLGGVSGTLQVERIRRGSVVSSTTLSPVNPGGAVTAQANPGYAAERGSINASLNFVIPANMMRNLVRLTLDVSTSGPCWPQSVSDTLDVQVGLRQRMRIAGIMVGYNGTNPNTTPVSQLTLAAPTVTNLQNTAALAYRMFPVAASQAGDFRNIGTITLNQPLTDAPNCAGCCSTRWVQLNNQIAAQQAADGNRAGWLYYGLLANGIPMGPIVGCNSSGVSSGSAGAQVTMAHEIGHDLGLAHAPCGGVGNSADNNYPAYEPYDPANSAQGRIGEYGLNIGSGNVFNPNTRDVMGYCGTNWVSLYHHSQLLNAGNLNVTNVPTASMALMDREAIEPRPSIVLVGSVEGGEKVKVDHVLRVTTRPDPGDGYQTDMVAELRDEDGEVISSGVVYAFDSLQHREGCVDAPGSGSEVRGIRAYIPDVGQAGASLVIRRDEEILWERKAPASEPRVEISALDIDEDQLHLSWDVDTVSEYPSDIMVRWSPGGEEWTVLASGLTGNEAELDIRHLPQKEVIFQVLVSDGFYTRTVNSGKIEVPDREPRVAIVSPGAELPVDAPVLHLACFVDRELGEDDTCVWYLDDEQVGSGTEVWMSVPEVGEHRLRVDVQMDDDRVSEQQRLSVIDPSREDSIAQKS